MFTTGRTLTATGAARPVASRCAVSYVPTVMSTWSIGLGNHGTNVRKHIAAARFPGHTTTRRGAPPQ